ncbi:MAG: radical SAM protein [Clostridia bacterium]|nr:radical SAM protein [Clostridia bacterium]
MEKIKRFVDCYIPTETCNLRCHYCYITQKRKFNSKLVNFSHSPETIRAALSRERLGGVSLINLCAGGETLLSEELLKVTHALIDEGHYVMIVTNGTLCGRFDQIAEWGREVLSHLFFKFSFHFLELERLGMMDRFFENVQKMKDAGASFTVEITPSDELIPRIEDVKAVCMEKLGAFCHVTIARDDRTLGIDVLSDHDFETYKQIWGQFDSELFAYKSEIFHKKRNEFCYAGDWTTCLNLETGSLRQCYAGKELCNIYEDISAPIPFEAIGHGCPMPHCYNGHAFLALGVIPELEAPTYADLRNRVCKDGSEWLVPEMKAFMNTKVGESNCPYSHLKRMKIRAFREGSLLYRFKRKLTGKGR